MVFSDQSSLDDVIYCNPKGFIDMGVSKNSGTPKWIVYNGKPY